jgi:hypothetical protein
MSGTMWQMLDIWVQIPALILALSHKLLPGFRRIELLGGSFDQPSQFFLLGSGQEGLPFGLIGNFVRLGAG